MQGRRVFPRRVFLGGAFSGAALAALTACASESGASSSAVSSEPSYASGWSDPAEPTRAPLTGLVSDSATIAGPALAVKIPNDTYGARPQVNLNSADHVYEELVEGGHHPICGGVPQQHPGCAGSDPLVPSHGPGHHASL